MPPEKRGFSGREPYLVPGYVQPKSYKPNTNPPPIFPSSSRRMPSERELFCGPPVSNDQGFGGTGSNGQGFGRTSGSNVQGFERTLGFDSQGCIKCQRDRIHCVPNNTKRCAYCTRWNYPCFYKKVPGCTNCNSHGYACVQDSPIRQDPWEKCEHCSQNNLMCTPFERGT